MAATATMIRPASRRLLRTADAAEYLGLSRSTLEKWRMRGEGPPFVILGPKAVAYDLADLDEWAESLPRRRSTSEAVTAS